MPIYNSGNASPGKAEAAADFPGGYRIRPYV